jgi:ribonuclease HI
VPFKNVEPLVRTVGKPAGGFWDHVLLGQVCIDTAPATCDVLPAIHSEACRVLYTDGSVRGFLGASAVACYDGFGAYGPPTSEGWCSPRWSDSFGAEQEGLLHAVNCLDAKGGCEKRAVILTDSLSNLLSLGSPSSRDEFEQAIQVACVQKCNLGWSITLKFIRGHAGHLGNEIADARCSAITAAGEGFLPDDERVIPLHL